MSSYEKAISLLRDSNVDLNKVILELIVRDADLFCELCDKVIAPEEGWERECYSILMLSRSECEKKYGSGSPYITAIKRCRELVCPDLREAKDAVDALVAAYNIDIRKV